MREPVIKFLSVQQLTLKYHRERMGRMFGGISIITDDCFNVHFQAWCSALLLLYTKETKSFAVSRI